MREERAAKGVVVTRNQSRRRWWRCFRNRKKQAHMNEVEMAVDDDAAGVD